MGSQRQKGKSLKRYFQEKEEIFKDFQKRHVSERGCSVSLLLSLLFSRSDRAPVLSLFHTFTGIFGHNILFS